MRYREYSPAPPLADLVARFWTIGVDDSTPHGHQHRVLPDGCVDLVVVSPGPFAFMTVRGPRAAPISFSVSPGHRCWGARLWPDAGARLLGTPATELVEQLHPAARFFGPDAQSLADHLANSLGDDDTLVREFEAWLTPRVAAMPPLDPAVRLAIVATNAAHGDISVASLAPMVGVSPRQLQRRFRAATGMTMKTYARIRRIRSSISHLVGGPARAWSEVAATLGFADQSHLISEFTRLAGAPPGEIAAYVAAIEHIDVIP